MNLDKIIVHEIENEEVAKRVLKIAEKHGYKWESGHLPSEFNFWYVYKAHMAYCFICNVIQYRNYEFYKKEPDYSDYRVITASEFIQEFGETKDETKPVNEPDKIKQVEENAEQYAQKEFCADCDSCYESFTECESTCEEVKQLKRAYMAGYKENLNK